MAKGIIMTTTSTERSDRTATGSPLVLRASAVAFAAAYIVAMFVPTLPEGAYSDARVLALLEDPGDRTRIILGGYALVIASIAMVIFVAALGPRSGTERSPGHAASRMAAASYACILGVAAAMFSSIPMGVALGELEVGRDPSLFRTLSNAGFHVLLVGGLAMASVLVAAVSLDLRRTDAPRWLPMLGFAVAPLLWLGFAWAPQFLLAVWVLVLGLTLGAGTKAR